MILGGYLASEAEIRRFLTEAETVARLDHPNIVPIYEVGEEDGQYFFSMKLIEGPSLAEALSGSADFQSAVSPVSNRQTLDREARVDTFNAAQAGSAATQQSGSRRHGPRGGSTFDIRHSALVISKVARAIHYAHQRGVLHRDLKPANILIDAQGEPHITDFGLARLLDAESALTHSSFAVLGTPPYMAPEQATGRSGAATVATDVYALGAILYELLAGRAPFQAATPLETLRKVAAEEPVPPLRRKSETRNPRKGRKIWAEKLRFFLPQFSCLNSVAFDFRPSDLEVICLKCLEKDSTHRYPSAAELADDLERWLRGEPILARSTGPLRCAAKWIKRQPLKAALLAVAACAVMVPTAIGIYYQRFVLPQHARASPLFTPLSDREFFLPLEAWNTERASANFSAEFFDYPIGGRYGRLEFLNVPANILHTLQCRVMADLAGRPDVVLTGIVRPGETVFVPRTNWRYRGYYFSPVGWTSTNLLARAPEAMIKFTLMPPDWKPDSTATNPPAGGNNGR